MKVWRVARYVLFIAAIGGIATLIALRVTSTTAQLSDGQVVFCLSATDTSQLAGAAVALDLAKPGNSGVMLVGNGRELTVEQWREAFPSAFDRACSALTESARIPADGSADPGVIVSLLINLAAVLVGGLIGWMSSEFRAAAERNRAQAEALSTAAREFDRETMDYLSAWANRAAPRPSGAALSARRADLAAQLGLVRSIHPRWKGVSSLQHQVLHGDLGEGLADSLLDFQHRFANGNAGSGWPDEIGRLKQSLHLLDVEVSVVVGTLLRASAWRRSNPASPLLTSRAAGPGLPGIQGGGGR